MYDINSLMREEQWLFKLSLQMLRVLRHVQAGRPVYDHCRTRSDYGGLSGTLVALRKRGLIVEDDNSCSLTALGIIALERNKL